MADVFDHVTIRVSDVEASLRFYELAFAQLGHDASHRGDGFYEWNDFSIWATQSGKPVTRGLHVALVAESRAAVDEWWRAMTGAGNRDDGAPERPQRNAGLCSRNRGRPRTTKWWGAFTGLGRPARTGHPDRNSPA